MAPVHIALSDVVRRIYEYALLLQQYAGHCIRCNGPESPAFDRPGDERRCLGIDVLQRDNQRCVLLVCGMQQCGVLCGDGVLEMMRLLEKAPT